MKNKLIFMLNTLLFCNVGNFASTDTTDVVLGTPSHIDTIKIEEDFTIQEEAAQFPGGEAALDNFIYHNVQYPAIAKAQGIEGKVTVAFIVDETGAVSHIEVVQGVGGGCDEEVVRVVSAMPAWLPANQAGHQVRTKKFFSFTFRLS